MTPNTHGVQPHPSHSSIEAATRPEPQLAQAQPAATTMSIFEIDEALTLLMESAVDAAGENGGEIPNEMRFALLEYCEAFGQKVDNIARYLRSQEFDAANAAAEIERLSARKAAAEHRIERLKGVLKFFMETRGINAMKGRLNSISLRKNSQDSLIVNDAAKLSDSYWRISLAFTVAEWKAVVEQLPKSHPVHVRCGNVEALPREPDNKGIRTALAAGVRVEGVELRRGSHIRLS